MDDSGVEAEMRGRNQTHGISWPVLSFAFLPVDILRSGLRLRLMGRRRQVRGNKEMFNG